MAMLLHIGLKQRGGRRSAFSLIEVTLAIGIVGFAFIPMMGLLPTGLNVFHQSIGVSVSAQIAQRVIGEAQQTDFTTLSSLAGSSGAPTRYFDNEGGEITDPTSVKWIYAVKTLVINPTTTQSGGIGGLQCTNLLNVVVQVVCDPGRKPLTTGRNGFVSASPDLSIQTFSGIVSANK